MKITVESIMSGKRKMPIGAIIALAIIKAISKLNCKLKCCCNSTCNQQAEEEETEVKWVDDKHIVRSQMV